MPMMLTALILATLAGVAPLQQTDTIVPVPAGARLDVNLMRAGVTVRVWDRREVHVVARPGPIEVRAADGTVKVRPEFGRGSSTGLERSTVELTIPRDMDVELEGQMLDADLRGVGGDVSVSSMQGNVRLDGGSGFVRIRTLQGSITCAGADGRVDLESSQGGVTATGIAGEIRAHSLNGRLELRGIRADAVSAYSLNGAIDFDGAIASGGEYTFESHAGNVTVAIPAGTGVTIEASTFGGAFESDFPVTLQKSEGGGRTVDLVLGDGKALMTLNSFGGTIRLRRP